ENWKGYFKPDGEPANIKRVNRLFNVVLINLRALDQFLPGPVGLREGIKMSIAKDLMGENAKTWKSFFRRDGRISNFHNVERLFGIILPNLSVAVPLTSQTEKQGVITSIGRDLVENPKSWKKFFNRNGIPDTPAKLKNVNALFRNFQKLKRLTKLLRAVGYTSKEVDGVRMAVAKDQVLAPKSQRL